jgi:hypothetical protein
MDGAPLGIKFPGYDVRPVTIGDLAASNELCRRVHGHDRGGELQDAVNHGTARVVEHLGAVTAYATDIAFFAHAVAESNQGLKALIGAASGFGGGGFLLPTRNDELFSDERALQRAGRRLSPLSGILNQNLDRRFRGDLPFRSQTFCASLFRAGRGVAERRTRGAAANSPSPRRMPVIVTASLFLAVPGIRKGGRTPSHTPRRLRPSASRGRLAASARIASAREPRSPLGAGAGSIGSVYALTHRAPGPRRSAEVEDHSNI